MHYAGINALSIPSGYCTLNYALVALSGIISWLVCIVGCILMSQMETHLGQQFLFSIAATTGVAAMHFTGKSLRPHSDVLILTSPRNGSCNILDQITTDGGKRLSTYPSNCCS